MAKYGEVFHIRFDPADVMSCIDLCRASGVLMKDMSLAQVVKLATAGLLEDARKQNIVPTRDGYEYAEMVQPFFDAGRNGKKLAVTDAIQKARVNIKIPAPAIERPEDSPEVKRKKSKLLMRIMELNQKKEVDPDNFSEADELQQLNAEFEKLL